MKLQNTLIALLCAGVFSAPAFAAGPQLDKAVSLAAPESKASLNDITLAVFNAVKEAPAEAPDIFKKVTSQRKDWTADQLYGILRAILLALPDLERNLSVLVKVPRDGEKAHADYPSMNPTLRALLVALAELSVSESVIQSVVTRLNLDAFDLREINIRYARSQAGGGSFGLNTNLAPGQNVIPGPGPVSPQN